MARKAFIQLIQVIQVIELIEVFFPLLSLLYSTCVLYLQLQPIEYRIVHSAFILRI